MGNVAAKRTSPASVATPQMPGLVLRCLRRLKGVVRHRAVDQLAHALQTATRAVHAGADEDMVLAALCHDIAKVKSWNGHEVLGAAILRPYVSREASRVVATHHDFLAIYNVNRSSLDPLDFRRRHRAESWYRTAVVFADEWDSQAYDPAAHPMSLESFVPLITARFARTLHHPNPREGFALMRRLAAAGQLGAARSTAD